MSYYVEGYLWKDNATFEDVSKVILFLQNLKKNYYIFCIEYLKDYHIFEEYEDDRDFKLYKLLESESMSTSRGLLYDCSLDISCYFYDKKIVLQPFGGVIGQKFMRKQNLPDWSTYDWYAGDEQGEPPEDFLRKQQFWDNVFKNTSIPSNVSLSFDIYDTMSLYDTYIQEYHNMKKEKKINGQDNY